MSEHLTPGAADLLAVRVVRAARSVAVEDRELAIDTALLAIHAEHGFDGLHAVVQALVRHLAGWFAAAAGAPDADTWDSPLPEVGP